MNLHGRSILLTGAGTGIGRSLALAVAGQQVRLTLVGRRRGPLEDVAGQVRAAGSEVHVIAADLTGRGAPADIVGQAAARFGGIDVLINNAGNVRAGRLEQLSEQDVLSQIALNLSAPVLLTRAALPQLRASGDSLIVIISSAMGLVGLPFYATYAATKAGIAHFAEALRRELHGEGVGVLTVYPGATRTPMMESSKAGPDLGFDYESPQEVAAAVMAGISDGKISVVRGGPNRTAMIAANRDDPAALDRRLAGRKAALERAVKAHSSL
ncbi:MAG: SDR family NAD(P)-dependent oxidoreductase [Actinomycetota bacterium]|nr:SDR family NAD(P)-dependent oxidoreductase [Actinomycetota bacterium]